MVYAVAGIVSSNVLLIYETIYYFCLSDDHVLLGGIELIITKLNNNQLNNFSRRKKKGH